jgi:hypothetical protein
MTGTPLWLAIGGMAGNWGTAEWDLRSQKLDAVTAVDSTQTFW